MTPYNYWLFAIPFLIWSILLLPSSRVITIPLFILHQLLLVIGINNLRINFFHKSYWYGKNSNGKIALTFDDGPDTILTPLILDLLKKYNFKATFFIIAEKIDSNEDLLNRMIKEGHTIASHDLHHSLFSNFRGCKTILKDLSKSLEIIYNVTGKRVLFYRPPVGLSNPNYKKALNDLGLTCISWSRKPFDAGNRRVGGIKRISQTPHTGDIILLHDALPIKNYKDIILENLELLFKNIKKEKLKPVTVDNILNMKAYS